jgi:hypothetical protein
LKTQKKVPSNAKVLFFIFCFFEVDEKRESGDGRTQKQKQKQKKETQKR